MENAISRTMSTAAHRTLEEFKRRSLKVNKFSSKAESQSIQLSLGRGGSPEEILMWP